MGSPEIATFARIEVFLYTLCSTDTVVAIHCSIHRPSAGDHGSDIVSDRTSG